MNVDQSLREIGAAYLCVAEQRERVGAISARGGLEWFEANEITQKCERELAAACARHELLTNGHPKVAISEPMATSELVPLSDLAVACGVNGQRAYHVVVRAGIPLTQSGPEYRKRWALATGDIGAATQALTADLQRRGNW